MKAALRLLRNSRQHKGRRIANHGALKLPEQLRREDRHRWPKCFEFRLHFRLGVKRRVFHQFLPADARDKK
jgi:hypothetical protein